MYITTDYLGIKKGCCDYLFYLLTEEYIESSCIIQSGLEQLLAIFGKKLAGNAAIVKPAKGMEKENLSRILNLLPNDFKYGFVDKTPALLMLDRDLNSFDPKISPHIVIPLRDLINETGHIKIFELQELLDYLVKSSRKENSFSDVVSFVKKSKLAYLERDTDIKLGFLGITINIKNFFKQTSQKTLYVRNISND